MTLYRLGFLPAAFTNPPVFLMEFGFAWAVVICPWMTSLLYLSIVTVTLFLLALLGV